MSLFMGYDIAEAITDALNGTGGPCENQRAAVRKHAVKATLEDVARVDDADEDEPIVTVFVRAYSRTRTGRKQWAYLYEIGVCVQSYCLFTDVDRVEELTLFTEQVIDFVSLAGAMADAALLTAEQQPLFDSTQLDASNQFLAIPTFTYRIERSS